MDRNGPSILLFLSLFLLIGCSSASTFISGDVFENHAFTGRNLLQARKACPVNFEFLNYTIITSQCRGPLYPANSCCSALKEFACPYSEELNDLSNECASTMFSYINLYGKYPPGLFSSECKEGKLGLECPPQLSEKASASSGGSQRLSVPHRWMTIFAGGLILLLFRLF